MCHSSIRQCSGSSDRCPWSHPGAFFRYSRPRSVRSSASNYSALSDFSLFGPSKQREIASQAFIGWSNNLPVKDQSRIMNGISAVLKTGCRWPLVFANLCINAVYYRSWRGCLEWCWHSQLRWKKPSCWPLLSSSCPVGMKSVGRITPSWLVWFFTVESSCAGTWALEYNCWSLQLH